MHRANEPADERRRQPRAAATLRVFYQHRGEAWLVEALTENLSHEGVFVRTTRPPLPVGTEVVIAIRLGDAEDALMARGAVTWVRESEHEDRGMGIRFADLDAEAQRRLAAVLEG